MSHIPKVYVWDGTTTVKVDAAVSALRCIEVEHAEIHAGDHYYVSDYATVAAAATREFLITTGAVDCHLTWLIDFNKDVQIALYEDGDKVGARAQTVFNNDRGSANTATTTVHEGTGGGTTDGNLISSWSGGLTLGGQARDNNKNQRNREIILKQSKKYILRTTSLTNGNIISTTLEWYEV